MSRRIGTLGALWIAGLVSTALVILWNQRPSHPPGGTSVGPTVASDPSREPEDLDGEPSLRGSAAASRESVDPVPDQDFSVRLHSSASLPLQDLRFRDVSSSDWQRAPDGVDVVLGAEDHAREVVARAHRRTRIPPGAGEVALEPDALLEVLLPSPAETSPWWSWDVGRNQRRWVEGISVLGATRDRWLLAVDVEAFRRIPAVSPPLRLVVGLRNGYALHADWNPRPGCRDRIVLPEICASPADLASLQVVAVGGPAHPDLEWGVSAYPDLDVETGVAGRRHVEELPVAWGVAQIRREPSPEPRELLALDSTTISLERAFLGMAYHVRAVSRDGRWVGHRVFRFDGTPVEVPLEPGRVLSLALHDRVTGAPVRDPVQVGVEYGGSRCLDHLCLWNRSTTVEPDDSGVVTFPGIGLPAADPLTPWPPPREGEITIRAHGWEPVSMDFACPEQGAEVVCDLGRLDLWPASPALRLVCDDAAIATRTGQLHSAQGDTRVVLREAAQPGVLEGWTDPPLELSDASPLLLYDAAAPAYFGLVPIGPREWRALDGLPYDLTIRRQTPLSVSSHIAAGVLWQGIRIPFSFDRERARTEALHLRFLAPGTAMEVWVEERDSSGERIDRRAFDIRPGQVDLIY